MIGSYHREIGSVHLELDLHRFLGNDFCDDALRVRAESVCAQAMSEVPILVVFVIPIDAVKVRELQAASIGVWVDGSRVAI